MPRKGTVAYCTVWETKKTDFKRDKNETGIQEKVIINCLNYQIFSDHLTNYYTTRGHKARHWEGVNDLYSAGGEADTQGGEAICVHLQCRSMEG